MAAAGTLTHDGGGDAASASAAAVDLVQAGCRGMVAAVLLDAGAQSGRSWTRYLGGGLEMIEATARVGFVQMRVGQKVSGFRRRFMHGPCGISKLIAASLTPAPAFV